MDKQLEETLGGFAQTTTDAILALDARVRALEGIVIEMGNLHEKSAAAILQLLEGRKKPE